MKQLIALSLIALMSFTFADPLPIGAVLPKADLRMTDISGKQITLKETFGDQGLLVMFTCNTCPVVIDNQERTKEICKYAATKKVGVVLLNSNEAGRNGEESLQAMKSYAKRQGYSWHYAVDKDSELANAFGANRTPECFLFDKSGKLIYHGAIDDNPQDAGNVKRNHLQHAIDELITGKEVSVKKTRSVGCSIKRA